MDKDIIPNKDEASKHIEELRKDHSCSQSTLMGLCIKGDMTQEKLAVLASGFSGGIGGTFDEGTCGALTGSVIALGLIEDDPELIKKHAKELFNTFKEEYGTVHCNIISKDGKDKTPCVDCCIFIADKAIDILNKEY